MQLHLPISVSQAINELENLGALLNFKLSHCLDKVSGISQVSATASEFFVFKQLGDACRDLKVAFGC